MRQDEERISADTTNPPASRVGGAETDPVSLTDAGRFALGLPSLIFWITLVGFVGYHAVRHTQKGARNEARMAQLEEDFETSDFEAWWRTTLRMHAPNGTPGADPVYFGFGEREENPSKNPPSFHTAMQLLTPLGPRLGALAFWLLSAAALVASLGLARGIVRRASRTESLVGDLAGTSRIAVIDNPWPARAALLLLIPFVHLCARYNQTALIQVFFVLAAIRSLPEHPWRGGFALAAATAIKPLTIVLLPFLIWKRAATAATAMTLGMCAAFAAVLVDVGIERGLELHADWLAALAKDPSLQQYHERYQGIPSFLLATITPVYEEQLGHPATGKTWDGIRNFFASESLTRNATALIGVVTGAVVLGCAAAVRWRPRPDTHRRWLLEFGLVLCAMLLITPTTWKHYYWFLAPALLAASIEYHEAFRGTWARAFLVIVLVTQTLPHRELPDLVWRTFHVFHGFAIGATGLWALLALRLWRARSEPEG